MDMLGPVVCKSLTKKAKSTTKLWFLLATDGASGLVNIEALPDQSAESVLQALEIMESRYGKIYEITSDAGSNFIPLAEDSADPEQHSATQGTQIFTNTLVDLKYMGR